jgi:2-Cys peroxiredoxin 5
MFAARRLALAPRRLAASTSASASFHSSAPAFVKVGDCIPDVELMEGSPGNKVRIADELKGKGLIIGRPPTKK